MKQILSIVLTIFCSILGVAQKNIKDSLEGFDHIHFQQHLSQIKDKTVRENYKKSVHRNYIKNKYNLNQERNIVVSTASTSTCGNFDFEDGTANGWTISGDYQIMSGVVTDPFGGFPVVCPGGNYSLRLNDNNTNTPVCSTPGTKTTFSASASRTIGMTSSNYLIKVNFAGATLNFPHSAYDAARIRVEFYDQFNNLITSPTYTSGYCNPPGGIVSMAPTTFSSSANQGWEVCNSAQFPVTYYPWQTKIFNLAAFIGQNIKLKLSADWCLYQYDWAYAYFDVCCDPSCPTLNGVNSTTNIYTTCTVSPFSSTLCNVTPGLINNQWSGSSGPISTANCITVNSAGSYTLVGNPMAYPSYTVNEIFKIGITPTINFSLPSTICNSSSGLTLFASPSGGVFTGSNVASNLFYPSSNGTYSITYTYTDSISGCSASSTQTIQVITCTSTGVQQLQKQPDFFISPNPFNSEVFIRCKDLPENSEFILFNTLGQEILRKRITEGKNSIETETLPSGLYFYALFSQNKQVKQGKLVKE